MPVLAPAFREINYRRIETLAKDGNSDATIASFVRDKTGANVTTEDITAYRKVTGLASQKMLVSKKTLDAAVDAPAQPQPA